MGAESRCLEERLVEQLLELLVLSRGDPVEVLAGAMERTSECGLKRWKQAS